MLQANPGPESQGVPAAGPLAQLKWWRWRASEDKYPYQLSGRRMQAAGLHLPRRWSTTPPLLLMRSPSAPWMPDPGTHDLELCASGRQAGRRSFSSPTHPRRLLSRPGGDHVAPPGSSRRDRQHRPAPAPHHETMEEGYVREERSAHPAVVKQEGVSTEGAVVVSRRRWRVGLHVDEGLDDAGTVEVGPPLDGGLDCWRFSARGRGRRSVRGVSAGCPAPRRRREFRRSSSPSKPEPAVVEDDDGPPRGSRRTTASSPPLSESSRPPPPPPPHGRGGPSWRRRRRACRSPWTTSRWWPATCAAPSVRHWVRSGGCGRHVVPRSRPPGGTPRRGVEQ